MPRGSNVVDWTTQLWVERTGREVDLTDHQWLDGPIGAADYIGDRWLEEYIRANSARVDPRAALGLVPDMSVLDGGDFTADELSPEVVDFYQRTGHWRLEVWSRWCSVFRPIGWILSALFARRLQQLNLPLDPLDASRGMDSQVIALRSTDGEHLGTAWQRTLRATGSTVFGGFYQTVTLPGRERPSIRVVFPLPNGNLIVLLRPELAGDGGLRLVSSGRQFGDEGAYLVVHHGGTVTARRVPVPEEFHVFLDDEGVLRTDHVMRFYRLEVIRFHYRLEPLT